ncbi:hypothetical protein AGABI2DRAFT_184960 [Agaricus bisporus var. bisporus H97]|uniref:hypothetical protein n=1 Tax=Agaricus bisporus var. bisporus (strain H97 / ATCC MYA-4626 / FGSC 10389) TaxID=936046 RepID=UPI00029F6E3D|nr:hypothetical protein AGABI2DRAFT_184960 [Agaricus bisporus var. bisporus H97]EKV48685.1 hypothetical protein AGABI2DRAFT_184960 [Agaricus bisporus var. bisporus H97]
MQLPETNQICSKSRNMKNSVKCDIANTVRTRSVKLDFPFSDNRDFIRTPHGNVLVNLSVILDEKGTISNHVA